MSEVKRFRHSKARVEDIEKIISMQAQNKPTSIIKKETGFSETVIQNINRIMTLVCDERELDGYVPKAMQAYFDKHGYTVKYKEGVDPESRCHRKKGTENDPVQMKMSIEEMPKHDVAQPDNNGEYFFTDKRLENALHAYLFILDNTMARFTSLNNMAHDNVVQETIKAATNIAFKYLSMETETARAKED